MLRSGAELDATKRAWSAASRSKRAALQAPHTILNSDGDMERCAARIAPASCGAISAGRRARRSATVAGCLFVANALHLLRTVEKSTEQATPVQDVADAARISRCVAR